MNIPKEATLTELVEAADDLQLTMRKAVETLRHGFGLLEASVEDVRKALEAGASTGDLLEDMIIAARYGTGEQLVRARQRLGEPPQAAGKWTAVS